MKLSLFCILVFYIPSVFSQNLLDLRIREISGRKKFLFFNEGVFHKESSMASRVKAMRHSYSTKRGYERIVVDFSSKKLPKIYGHFSSNEKKLSLDFFKTSLNKNVGSFGVSNFVKAFKFYPLSKEFLSMEILFKEAVKAEIFYLNSPARLVIDIKV